MGTLSACLIVRNEENTLERCLKSLYGEVDEIVVVDTGSTDSTINIAKKFNAKIVKFEWNDNFSEARNISLNNTECDWIIFLDADEELVNSESKKLKTILNKSRFDAYNIRIVNLLGNISTKNETSIGKSIRIFRNKPNYRFSGAIHEQIMNSLLTDNAKISDLDAYQIKHYGYLKENRINKKKFERNVSLLQKEINRCPKDSFHLFNMGMEYYASENYKEAIKYFKRSYENSNSKKNFYPRMIRNYIYSLKEVGNFNIAIKIYDREIKKFEDYTDLWYIGAIIYFSKKQYDKAIHNLEKCLSLGDCYKYESNIGLGSFKALNFLGKLYMNKRDYENAVKYFKRGTILYPEILNNFTELSKIYLQSKDYKNAYQLLCIGKEYHNELNEICMRIENILKKK
jgi:glycosyltransferase involved in cell wall biosynthesis